MSLADELRPDLYDYDFENDPIETLNRLRTEDPVHWSRHGFWYLTRYEDCATVLKDPVGFSSMAAGWGGENPLARSGRRGAQSREEQGISRNLAVSFNQMDPPDHTRIRALVVSAFSRRNIEERRARIQAVIDDLLDAAAVKRQFDLVTDFGFHLPIIVASEIIGIPTGDRTVPPRVRKDGRADGAQALGGVVGRGRRGRALRRPLHA